MCQNPCGGFHSQIRVLLDFTLIFEMDIGIDLSTDSLRGYFTFCHKHS